MKNRRLIIIIATIVTLLIIPFFLQLFNTGVAWKTIDFIIIGSLLTGAGLLFELVMRKVKSTQNRIILCAAILFVFFLVWAEVAVGIIGSPFAGS